MFQIMTEAEIKAADEETLRQRVRELLTATHVLREIRDYQERTRNCLMTACDSLHNIEAYLRYFRDYTERQRKKKRAPPRRKRAKRK